MQKLKLQLLAENIKGKHDRLGNDVLDIPPKAPVTTTTRRQI